LLIVGLRQRLQNALFGCQFVWIEGKPFLRTPRVRSPHHPSKDFNGAKDASVPRQSLTVASVSVAFEQFKMRCW
jgi:hypothetical protein